MEAAAEKVQAPAWKYYDTCHVCGVKFSIFTRQHHCRACGEAFCSDCSYKQSAIPKIGIEREVRVCDHCYNEIKASDGGIQENANELPLNSDLPKEPENVKLFTIPQTTEELKQSSIEAKRSKSKHHSNMLDMVQQSLNINRCMGQASILLFGVSGAGKSSLVNNFFDADICDICKISDAKACTKSTVERKAISDNKYLRIKGLTMSLIDTPGIEEEKKGNARNFWSIQQFLQTHPSYVNAEQKVYPNVILLVHKVDDTRIYGKGSELAKTIKALKELNVVDKEHPNLVMVFTHASKSLEDPFIRFREIKESAEDLISAYLKIKAPILFVENVEKEDLMQIGDWHILPDGSQQLLNVYEAMIDLFQKNGDKLAYITISHFFKKKNKVISKDGHCVQNTPFGQKLSPEERQWFKFFNRKHNETKENMVNLNNHFDDELDIANGEVLFDVLGESGIKFSDLQTLGVSEILSKIFPVTLDPRKQNILRHLLEEKSLRFDLMKHVEWHAGKGYNIFKDVFRQSVYEFDKGMTFIKYCLALPNGLEVTFHRQTRDIHLVFKTPENYQSHRLKCLGIKSNINLTNVEAIYPRYGCNVMNSLSRSHLLEEVIFSARVDYHKAMFRPKFQEASKKLPRLYNAESKQSFLNFFQEWGHFVVMECDHGGSVEGITHFKKDKSVEENFKEAKLKWEGGDLDFWVLKGKDITDNQWKSWTDSLSGSPVPLNNNMKLRSMPDILTELSYKHKGLISPEQIEALKQAHRDICGAPEKRALTKDEAADTALESLWKRYLKKIDENLAWCLAMPGVVVYSGLLTPWHFVQKAYAKKQRQVEAEKGDEDCNFLPSCSFNR